MDRNVRFGAVTKTAGRTSLSARRAWIEIMVRSLKNAMQTVALRKESVDRNNSNCYYSNYLYRRSPQGERG